MPESLTAQEVSPIVRIVCALQHEAKPLIERFRMKQYHVDPFCRIYLGHDGLLSLTVTGAGKLAAAMATTATAQVLRTQKHHAWLNLGIAGHGAYAVGTVVLANHVHDAGRGLDWYPQTPDRVNLTRSRLHTLDQPSSAYQQCLFDMEASGFCFASHRAGTNELIHVMKIVSDNPGHPVSDISPGLVTALVRDNLDTVEQFILSLRRWSAAVEPVDIEPEFNRYVEQFHFSEYQRHRLRSLLKRWQVLKPGVQSLGYFRELPASDATAVLTSLEQELDRMPVTPGPVE